MLHSIDNFSRSGSVVVDSLSFAAPIILGWVYYVFDPCFVNQYLVSFPILQSPL